MVLQCCVAMSVDIWSLAIYTEGNNLSNLLIVSQFVFKNMFLKTNRRSISQFD